MADLARRSPLVGLEAELRTRSSSTVELRPAGFLSIVNLRVSQAGRGRVEQLIGAPLPAPNRVVGALDGHLLGLGPDEWMVVAADGLEASIAALLREGIGGAGELGAVIEHSGNWTGLILAGPDAREVLASCCTLDFHPAAFGPGRCAQTLLAKAPMVIHQLDARPTYRILVRPSFADYVGRWLIDGALGLGDGRVGA